jgi:hypothetical protein
MKTLYTLFLFFIIATAAFGQPLDGVKLNNICLPAVVCIATPSATGSGFVVEKNGYIVTNYHVIKNDNYGIHPARQITVEFSDGRKETCVEIVRQDEQMDLVLLKINKTNCSILPIFDGILENGSEVAAFGCPAGQKMQYNKGTISKIDVVEINKSFRGPERIQVDIVVNQGNSGGAIVNKNGQVIGVVHAKRSKINGNEVAGFNYAIKSEVLLKFLSRANLSVNTKPLLTDEELKIAGQRELTDAEKKADMEKELARIEEEKRTNTKKSQADRDIIERDRQKELDRIAGERAEEAQRQLDLAEFNRMSKAQQEDLAKQNHNQQKARSAKQHELEIQRIEETSERQRMQLEQEKLNLRNAEDAQRSRRKAYFEALPQRFSTRIGVGATYYIATLGNSGAANFDVNNIGFLADVMFGYRLDRKGNNYKSRATTIGANVKLGAWNNSIIPRWEQAQNWNSNYGNLRTEQPFVEFGATFLLREWFKLEANYGTQYIYAAQDIFSKAYGNVTTGFIIRFGAVELEATASTLWLQDFAKPTFRGNLMLVYHAKWAKW